MAENPPLRGAKERIPKFKKRAVSAVRDWPLGCGPASEQHLRQIVVVSTTDIIDIESIILTAVRLSLLCVAEGGLIVEIPKV
ncbi:hypothetical protein EPI10_027138 [Gossypium australe]|uniref:Uncharacterized protein n=1 Tax=Gossypium australe TaxID=47621 RepID=A0A5B6UQT6_9ROSI|nr:hypothetical protein EPI10_027138 [Gossypium australe]